MIQFKVGDKVYYPQESNSIFTIEASGLRDYPLKVGKITFIENGRHYSTNQNLVVNESTPCLMKTMTF